ncbi:hypothetical protein LJC25_01530, partial [Bacteroidales bacterium OttesenSCG-928-K03]|nr:hypothetical protein [Bacteroidales bacterium OttesenSCG-928-K03]
KTKIHDKFSVEFKIGFIVRRSQEDNDFILNTWIFVPNSLDINPSTYDKTDFYRDLKSNVRLITPIFLLRDITGGDAKPYNFLKSSFENVASNPLRTTISDYIYQIKMFCAILKSSLRNESELIIRTSNLSDKVSLCNNFLENVNDILAKYKNLWRIINVPIIKENDKNHYSFGDEYICHIASYYTLKVLKNIEKQTQTEDIKTIRESFIELTNSINAHRASKGYFVAKEGDADNNSNMIQRHSFLKKYVESDLFVKLDKKPDGVPVQQIYFSLAAGIAMIFATVIAFYFQKTYGNYSMPLFVALVVSYMLKDRIKDLMRYYFAHKLKGRFFDNKASIHIKDDKVGWIKEGVDFITDDKTPPEVLELRNRSSLLQVENEIFDEKILLYRMKAYINNKDLASHYQYRISGLNDIIRLYINNFTLKMDNPEISLETLSQSDEVISLNTRKIYNINIVMQLKVEDTIAYKGFRVVISRDGILDILELDKIK